MFAEKCVEMFVLHCLDTWLGLDDVQLTSSHQVVDCSLPYWTARIQRLQLNNRVYLHIPRNKSRKNISVQENHDIHGISAEYGCTDRQRMVFHSIRFMGQICLSIFVGKTGAPTSETDISSSSSFHRLDMTGCC